MTTLTPARRRPAALLAAASAGLLLSGCSFWAPTTAIDPWTPAEGLQSEVGDLLARNILVVSEGDGAPGVVVGALVNRGEEDITAVVEVEGTEVEVDVPAGVSVVLGEEQERPDGEASTLVSELVEIDSVEPPAGAAVDVTVTHPSEGSTVLRVPVRTPEGIYADLVPGGSDRTD